MSQTLHSVVKRCTQAVHPSKKQKKHSREHSLDIDSGDDKGHDSAGSYIEDDARQSKHHSERVQRIRKSIMKLDNKCRPYILLYVARPESILMRNGKAQIVACNSTQSCTESSGKPRKGCGFEQSGACCSRGET